MKWPSGNSWAWPIAWRSSAAGWCATSCPTSVEKFYAQLPFMVLATVDAQGDPWATLLEGEPGFETSPEPTLLVFTVAPAAHDPALAGWQAGAAIGLLGIALHSRRRNRVNGLLQPGPRGLPLKIENAFGNCPQYIQARGLQFAHVWAPSPNATSAAARRWP